MDTRCKGKVSSHVEGECRWTQGVKVSVHVEGECRWTQGVKVSFHVEGECRWTQGVKVSSYVVRYPILRVAEAALHLVYCL